jgi:hypothetical protein
MTASPKDPLDELYDDLTKRRGVLDKDIAWPRDLQIMGLFKDNGKYWIVTQKGKDLLL